MDFHTMLSLLYSYLSFSIMTQSLTIIKPDDWHVHFRDADILLHSVPATAMHWSRALVMPNLKPPLTTITQITEYRERVLAALSETAQFTPYFTFYLNESITPDTLKQAANVDYILGCKLYPAGATTNSEAGVRSLRKLYPLLEIMEKCGLVLQVHGEVTEGDIFEREKIFIDKELQPLVSSFPGLRIIFEHISTEDAADFVRNSSDKIAATITPQHVFYNRNQLLAGGLRPHYYCLPILKHEKDQKAIRAAAVSGNPKFFAGTDSAPHAVSAKENACGCAGIYSAPYALSMYAQVFEEEGQLERLESFTSRFGAQFYGLPLNMDTITLCKITQQVPPLLPLGNEHVVPIAADMKLLWSV